MTKAAIISPHLDDAVLSCGQLMGGWPNMTVITVCAGIPEAGFVSQYDEDSGFDSSRWAMVTRRAEDTRAVHRLGGQCFWLDQMDGAYPDHVTQEAAAAAIWTALKRDRIDVAFFPAGISHPVHQIVAAACREIAASTTAPATMWVYEELPYRVIDPPEAQASLDEWLKVGSLFESFAGTGSMEDKEAAVGEYKSQLWALNQRCLFVPERFWRLLP